jgi:hypothetical protein
MQVQISLLREKGFFSVVSEAHMHEIRCPEIGYFSVRPTSLSRLLPVTTPKLILKASRRRLSRDCGGSREISLELQKPFWFGVFEQLMERKYFYYGETRYRSDCLFSVEHKMCQSLLPVKKLFQRALLTDERYLQEVLIRSSVTQCV